MLDDEIIYSRENVTIRDHVITYAYEVSPYPVLNEAIDILEATANDHKDFFKKLNMSLLICCIPQSLQLDKINAYYEKEKAYVFDGLADKADEMAKNMQKKVKNASKKYHVYVFVVENLPSFQKMNPIADKIRDTKIIPETFLSKKEAKKTLNNALVTEQDIAEVFEHTLGGARKVKDEELNTLYSMMRCYKPEENFVPTSLYDFPQPEYIEYSGDVENKDGTLKKVKWYEQFMMIEDLSEHDRPANNFLTQIQQSGLPITFYFKIHFQQPDKVHKEMITQKNAIMKNQKKFRAAYKRSSTEYQKQINKAQKGITAFELTDDSSARFQIIFRLHASSEEALIKYRERIQNSFKRIAFQTNYMIGRQELLREHIMPFESKTAIKKHHMTDLEYISNLNLLGGSDLGEEVGHIFFTNVKTKEMVALAFRKLMAGEAKSKAATSFIFGGTGSGKSMLAYFIELQLFITSGFAILKINPKNDEQNIGTHQKWILPYYQNIVLGSDGTHKGSLDPCLLYEGDLDQIKSVIKNDLNLMLRAMNHQNINLHAIDIVIDGILDRKMKLNMTTIKNVLDNDPQTKHLADAIGTLENTTLGRLMIADDNTDFKFDFSKPFTVLTFDNFPIISEFNENNLEHVIANMVLSKTSQITQQFANYWQRAGILHVDEYYIWSSYPQGEATVDMMGRIIRSKGKHMFISTQNVSDDLKKDGKDSLGNNVAMIFIGLLESRQEIKIAKERFNLSNSLVKHLEKKLERSKISQKLDDHDFIMIDYDKKRGIVEAIVPNQDMFDDYDNAFKQSDQQTSPVKIEEKEEILYETKQDTAQDTQDTNGFSFFDNN